MLLQGDWAGINQAGHQGGWDAVEDRNGPQPGNSSLVV